MRKTALILACSIEVPSYVSAYHLLHNSINIPICLRSSGIGLDESSYLSVPQIKIPEFQISTLSPFGGACTR